jgi:hypothetical protein
MKKLTYIEFPSGWRPPAYRNIKIESPKLATTGISKNGNTYAVLVLVGLISDEDATFIKLADPGARIKEVVERRK